MSVLGQLLPNGKFQANGLNGSPLVGGKLYSYAATTTTPKATYTDASLATPNANPVVLDSSGAASVWIDNSGYKFILKDSVGNTLWSNDQVYLVSPGSIGTAQLADEAVTPDKMDLSTLTSSDLPTGLIDTPNIKTGAVTGGTGGKIANQTIEFNNLDPAIDLTALNNMVEIVYRKRYDLSGERLEAIPQYPWSTPALLSPPSAIPSGVGTSSSWSPCGNFLAVSSSSSPYILVYERAGTTFNKLPDPGTLPTGGATKCKWSPNGDFLAVSHATSPFITIYQKKGNTLTKLSDPSTLPGGTGFDVNWTSNGEYLLVNSAPNSTGGAIYSVTGTTFTYFSSSAPNASGAATSGCFSHDSQYCVTSAQFSDALIAYQRAASVFSSITAPATPAGFPNGLAFSPDDLSFAVAMTGGDNLALYNFSSALGTFTQLSSPSSLPGAGTNGVAWSPNGLYLAFAIGSAPYLIVYQRSGSTYTALTAPSSQPAGVAQGVSWSPNGEFLAVVGQTTPYIQIYQTSSSSLPSNALFWARSLKNV